MRVVAQFRLIPHSPGRLETSITRQPGRFRERSRLGDRLAVSNFRNETVLGIRTTTVGRGNYYAVLAMSIDRARLLEILF